MKSSQRAVGIIGYLILAAIVIIALALLVVVIGPTLVIIGIAVIGGIALAALGPKPYALWVGAAIVVIALIFAVVTSLSTGLGF